MTAAALLPTAYQPDIAPVADSLTASALIALLPLLTVFLTLGVLRWKAHWAGLSAVAVAIIVAWLFFEMPVGLAALAATEGAAFGLFPIMWIVFTAIVLYQVTVRSGHFEDLRATFHLISDDPRIQAIIIAFCFGGLLEALAGFGAPVAITGVMLMAVGFSPLRAAAIVLLANTAPVAFGAIGTPIITAGTLTKIPYTEIGAYVGHQTPVIALFVPLLLVLMADGRRGVRQVWPVAVVVGLAFAVFQWFSATYLSVELTDIIASLGALAAAVVFLRFWQPQGREEALDSLQVERERDLALVGAGAPAASRSGSAGGHAAEPLAVDDHHASMAELDARARSLNAGRITMALFPYLLVIVVFAIAKLIPAVKEWLGGTDVKVPWPGLAGEVLTHSGKPSAAATYTFPWLSSPGTMLLICSLIVAFVYGVGLSGWGKEFAATAHKMRFAFLTVASVLALAYVMNLSGQTITIGTWIAGAGAAFAFLSPLLGWIGTAVTGSDTSANALFATLQQTAAQNIGIDPTLLVAANTSGGVVGKMISPQNLTIAATAVGLLGRESDIFRKVVPWSIGLILVVCLLVGLQSSVLAWMLP
ncbi:L-lactate permease [Intrasporangium calvum]|uniref:L-lactate permease n=1 Tax=Intrasporangium calvum (strain ATCC 23552 / DSM 43043 / JCM 3097 / NBRC 12989 / NCIMB 10167 / NRRL B-3866 / 7 KIP) TaxID=710696 RepID=E6SBL6_INTC7|nr:L-lactate permease [Intrasporangium calvum]ADU47347.1 L-lactate transport [Intrasporangium calvum DSM 43043]